MLGGGIFVSQNKVLPGSYINFVNVAKATANLGERGIVAIPMHLNKQIGSVIELTRLDFVSNSKDILGLDYNDDKLAPLREIFCNATKVFVYDLGEEGGESAKTTSDAIAALEHYDFNILCPYTNDDEAISQYITTVKAWRDDMGKKCQLVVYNQDKPDHEGIINVVSTVDKTVDTDAPEYALVAWVAGAEAGCEVNESCTNKKYDGEYTVVCDKRQTELEDCIEAGQIVFHLVYGDVCLLEDITSLTTTDATKGIDFKSNQTIRVLDQIANDIAKLFNTKYLGKIPNNATGRASLWADIVKHHRELERLGAIENFDAEGLTVEQGDTKKAVVVTETIIPVNAMAQLYMTVYVA